MIEPKSGLGKDLRFRYTSTGALGFTYQVTVRAVTAVIGGVARSVEAAPLAASANVRGHTVPIAAPSALAHRSNATTSVARPRERVAATCSNLAVRKVTRVRRRLIGNDVKNDRAAQARAEKRQQLRESIASRPIRGRQLLFGPPREMRPVPRP